jgi:multicomponent Na+:H+ antiporter subunit B
MIKQCDNVIVQSVSRFLTPFILLFALYVIAHGHYSPGGGFQGGCILGASFILSMIAYDIAEVKRRMTEKMNTVLTGVGVLIYAGIGFICLLLGANYLDYGVLAEILPVGTAKARALGTFGIEIGVGITVMAVMVSIFLNLASGGEHEEGSVE